MVVLNNDYMRMADFFTRNFLFLYVYVFEIYFPTTANSIWGRSQNFNIISYVRLELLGTGPIINVKQVSLRR